VTKTKPPSNKTGVQTFCTLKQHYDDLRSVILMAPILKYGRPLGTDEQASGREPQAPECPASDWRTHR
jgi:hypothetical protein